MPWLDRAVEPAAAAVGQCDADLSTTTAPHPGVGEERAGLAAGLLNTGQQVGTALGLAILSAVATAHTDALVRAGNGTLQAATQGYGRALLAGAAFVLAGGAIALLAPGDRKAEPVGKEEPGLDLAA
jgi:hypothetical protein